jgi:hypothetical protein
MIFRHGREGAIGALHPENARRGHAPATTVLGRLRHRFIEGRNVRGGLVGKRDRKGRHVKVQQRLQLSGNRSVVVLHVIPPV